MHMHPGQIWNLQYLIYHTVRFYFGNPVTFSVKSPFLVSTPSPIDIASERSAGRDKRVVQISPPGDITGNCHRRLIDHIS